MTGWSIRAGRIKRWWARRQRDRWITKGERLRDRAIALLMRADSAERRADEWKERAR